MHSEPEALIDALTERVTRAEAELAELRRNVSRRRWRLGKRGVAFLAVFMGLAIVAGVRLGMADSPPLAGEVVPRQIPYRGVLQQNGAPVTDAAVPMRFLLCASATAAPPALWEEERTVAVVNGIFSVDLGDLTPIPSAVLQLPALYLEVQVNGQTLTGRQRLMSVPYAQRAAGAYQATPGVTFVADSLQVTGAATVGAALTANTLEVTGSPDGGAAITALSASMQTASLAGDLNLANGSRVCIPDPDAGTPLCFCPRTLVRCNRTYGGGTDADHMTFVEDPTGHECDPSLGDWYTAETRVRILAQCL